MLSEGLNQREAAEKLGVSRQAVSEWLKKSARR
ncbi:helix-turn-helix domain-containing protein [Cloacibacillus sp.]|nr:helix-turn-helix domain-containing protein [Cloacibacillus sp.]